MSLDNRTSVLAMVAIAIMMCAALFGAIAVATSSNHSSDTQHYNHMSDSYSSFYTDSDTTDVNRIRTVTIIGDDSEDTLSDSRIVIRKTTEDSLVREVKTTEPAAEIVAEAVAAEAVEAAVQEPVAEAAVQETVTEAAEKAVLELPAEESVMGILKIDKTFELKSAIVEEESK